MKRWVWLGLLGMVACKEKPVEPSFCPGTDVDPVAQSALPADALASTVSGATASGTREEAVLVRFKPQAAASNPLLAAASYASAVEGVGGTVKARFGSLRAVAARVTPEQRRALEARPDVEAVEPDRAVHAMGLMPLPPAGALLGATSGSTGEYTDGVKMVQANLVWDGNNDATLDDGAPTGNGITVCVIDSGIDPRQPELQGVVVGQHDFVENDDDASDCTQDATTHACTKWGGGHGTHVAGTIAAQLGQGGSVLPGSDPNGVVGVAPGAKLLIARVLDTKGDGTTSDVISALKWCATNGAKVVSLSLGSQDASTTEQTAFQESFDKGLLALAASGNSGTADPATSPPVAFPAGYPSVVAVGAVSFSGAHPDFSQGGDALSLVAPGVNVLSSMIVGNSTYSVVKADGAEFASDSLEYAGIGDYSGAVVNCGLGDSDTSCGQNQCDGFVAYVDRGTVTFGDKVRHVLKQGAKAIIVGNNDPNDTDGAYTLGAPGNWPPTAIVSYSSGATIRGLAGKGAQVKLVGVDYAREVGTSMATPHASGVAALVWSAKPTLTNAEVRDILQKTAKDLGNAGRDNTFGYGLVQACPAVQMASGVLPPGCVGAP